ncbi:putative fungal-specific transcription factor [Xylogone sp. PMI_703]|nr:putative fungal-specific transcription factor [Xylogone sp. PMI_703]
MASIPTRQPPSGESGLSRARQVCSSCKARKRKCDKALPKCSACSKMKLMCKYLGSEQTRNSVSVSTQWWYDLRVNDHQANVQSIDYPAMLFLDPEILKHGPVEVYQPIALVPEHILHLLGDMNQVRTTASKFFEHIHLWMPFISKKRFYQLYLQSPLQTRPDTALLILSLKLITTLPPTSPRNPRTPLYYAAKHFYLEVEGSSILSVLVLQAGVLLAIYELGHAIYPAAFLSISACARYAHILGIKVSKTVNTTRVLTLVEAEERRRVWWAIVILDRFVSIGSPGRPLATTDPGLDDILPANDMAWDEGIVKSDDSFTLASPMIGHMSKFALLCQAARLLGQVLHNISSGLPPEDSVWGQIDRTLQSMVAASLNVDSPDNDQIAFVYSALVAMYTPWLYSDSISIEDKDHSQRARAIIQQITERIGINLVENQCFLGRNPEDMSPWGLFFAYHICKTHICYNREILDASGVVESLKKTFLTIDVRWNVAGIYLQLLEAQEVPHNS